MYSTWAIKTNLIVQQEGRGGGGVGLPSEGQGNHVRSASISQVLPFPFGDGDPVKTRKQLAADVSICCDFCTCCTSAAVKEQTLRYTLKIF